MSHTEVKGTGFYRLVLVVVSAFLLGFATLTSVSAFAGTATGSTSSFTAGGYTYNALSMVATSGTHAGGSTSIYPVGVSTVPSAYMGAMARVYWSGGALHCSNGYLYNSGSSGLQTATCSKAHAVKQGDVAYFYGYGVVRGYNNSAYKTHYTVPTSHESV
ncbi:hypothetical protein [Salana multivorans]